MSGITPLLDTLLHQVLGKRVDTPPPQDLNQPVKPTSPADAPRALHSDSRLDARTGTTQTQNTTRTATNVADSSTPLPRQEGVPPASSQTHLSSAGRTIADLLMRFPAPPSILTTKTPLVPAGQAPDPTHVASRLEGSVRDSGLFYESHLNRWYKGELPRQQLEREPQMWRVLRFSPAVAPGAGGLQEHQLLLPSSSRPSPPSGPQQSLHATSATANQHTIHSSTTPVSGIPTTASAPASPASQQTKVGQPQSSVNNDATTLRQPPATIQEPVHESLQGIVRHQLEMLVAPALRWEGDVWSGLFMALLIQPPAGQQESREGAQNESAGEDSPRTWRSDIDLDIQGAGRIKASVWLQATRLEIDIHIADPETLDRLQQGLSPFKARLSGHGFDDIGITLMRLTTETSDVTS